MLFQQKNLTSSRKTPMYERPKENLQPTTIQLYP